MNASPKTDALPAVTCTELVGRLERVVAELADPIEWNWTAMMSERDAADCALAVLAREGLIERAEHPDGGKIWRVGERLFGRTDGITNKRFDALKRPTKHI